MAGAGGGIMPPGINPLMAAGLGGLIKQQQGGTNQGVNPQPTSSDTSTQTSGGFTSLMGQPPTIGNDPMRGGFPGMSPGNAINQNTVGMPNLADKGRAGGNTGQYMGLDDPLRGWLKQYITPETYGNIV